MYVPNKKRGRGEAIVAVIVAAVVVGVWVLIQTSTGGQGDGAASTDATGGYRDGKFQFEVDGVQCGKAHAAGETAQGQFCLVHMRVENIGTEPQTFDASDQYAHDSDGRKFGADTMASSGSAFLQDINPGNAVTATVVFDIPKGDTLTSLELHDSPFSEGVPVPVGWTSSGAQTSAT